jgi:hypothetical protein
MCKTSDIGQKCCAECGKPLDPERKNYGRAKCCSKPCYRKFWLKREKKDIASEYETVKSMIEKDDEEFEDNVFLTKVYLGLRGLVRI